MEPAIVISALSLISTWIILFNTKRGNLSDKERNAVSALNEAVNQTRIYLKNKEESGLNPSHLSSLWNTAYRVLSEIDQDVARRCRIKSGYWSEPDRWTSDQIQMADITLKSMEEELKKFQS